MLGIRGRLISLCSRGSKYFAKLVGFQVGYRLGEFNILLPPGHPLPVYQRVHPKYDRFLPHLVSQLPAGSIVVDVGANVGDTLAAMLGANPCLIVLCVEPDVSFFEFLLKNVEIIRSKLGSAQIFTVNTLVGKEVISAQLVGDRGTKHAVPSIDGGMKSRSLDEIVNDLCLSRVRLIKCDVDGFDYDVIRSASSVLARSKPILFFEAQYQQEFQKEAFDDLVDWLIDQGYSDWTLFDNFGAMVLRTADRLAIRQLMNYVWSQNKSLSTRTVHYFDCLVCAPEDRSFVDLLLKSY